MFMPSRGGSRGGKDQFDWDDVKADKYRENYLGTVNTTTVHVRNQSVLNYKITIVNNNIITIY